MSLTVPVHLTHGLPAASLYLKQRAVLESFIQRRDAFASLPTGSGKSLLPDAFASLPTGSGKSLLPDTYFRQKNLALSYQSMNYC